MSKAIIGAAEIGLAVGFFATAAFVDPALLANLALDKAIIAIGMSGIAMEAGAIAGALSSNRGMNVTTRQPAANRQIIYGEQRVGGVLIYRSTTGGHHDQYNQVCVIASHECNALVNLYLDGRQVFWNGLGTGGNTTQNGVNFGGPASGGTKTGPDGQQYNFDGLVYAEARYGDQLPGDVIAGLTANDPRWAAGPNGSPYVGGCTYFYFKYEYDQATFPQETEIRVTVQGKLVYDPRTETTVYSNNAALVILDVLLNKEYGAGFSLAEINLPQFIAAANICDEQVPLAAGGTEARYTINKSFDTAVSPGDILASMLPAAGARLSWIGGQWYLFPAAWIGPSYSLSEADLLSKAVSPTYKSFRDMFNEVRGTYIAPVYPYSIAGNLYDHNGFYDGTIQNNFGYAWQATDYPAFLEDINHGYAANQWLTQDAGNSLVQTISYDCVISCATAQRLGKIALRRNRQRISVTLQLHLNALQLQECDVVQFTYSPLGWNNKLFEVTAMRLIVDNGNDSQAPTAYVEVDLNETDPSIFEWNAATDELSPATDAPFAAVAINGSPTPAPPTSPVLTDSAATAVIGTDGIVRPRIGLSWTAPAFGNAAQIQIQVQPVGSSTWMDAGLIDADNTAAFIGDVVQGQSYNIQLRSVTSRGAASAWVSAGTHTVSNTTSQLTAAAFAPGVVPRYSTNESPSGSGTSFTLAQAPAANSLQVYNAATGALITSGYSVSGKTLSTTSSYAAGGIIVSYRY